MRDHLFAQKTDRVHDLLMRRRTDPAQQDHLFDRLSLIDLDKLDAFLGGADAEFFALFAHFGGRRLAGMGAGGEPLVARVIALVIGRHIGGVVVAPDEPRPFALLLDVPPDQFRAARNHDLQVFVAEARGHQRGARARGGRQSTAIDRHQLLDTGGTAFAAEEATHYEIAGLGRGLVGAAGRPQWRVWLLQRFWQDFAAWDLEVLAVVGDLLLRPDAWQNIGELLPHAARIAQVG